MYEGTDLFTIVDCNSTSVSSMTAVVGYTGEGVRGGEVVTPVISVTDKVNGEEIVTITFHNVQVRLAAPCGTDTGKGKKKTSI